MTVDPAGADRRSGQAIIVLLAVAGQGRARRFRRFHQIHRPISGVRPSLASLPLCRGLRTQVRRPANPVAGATHPERAGEPVRASLSAGTGRLAGRCQAGTRVSAHPIDRGERPGPVGARIGVAGRDADLVVTPLASLLAGHREPRAGSSAPVGTRRRSGHHDNRQEAGIGSRRGRSPAAEALRLDLLR